MRIHIPPSNPCINAAMFLFDIADDVEADGYPQEARLLRACSAEPAHYLAEDGDRVLVIGIEGKPEDIDWLGDPTAASSPVIARAAAGHKPPWAASVQFHWRWAVNDPANQGRGGFPAPHRSDYLRYRGTAEMRIGQAFDKTNVLFFPNCRGRLGPPDGRRAYEPDFDVTLPTDQGPRRGILEVDGSQHEERDAVLKDRERDRYFRLLGIRVVERFSSTECYHDPDAVVANFLEIVRRNG